MKYTENIALGTMFGVAIGDALGAPVEFMTAEGIKEKYGRIKNYVGGGWLNVKPGEVTDDTQMTLCVARGIYTIPANPVESTGLAFVRWIMSGPKDVGGTCSRSIRGAMEYGKQNGRETIPMKEQWLLASQDTHNLFGGRSAGNGSLMRTAYVGLFYGGMDEISLRARELSKMTHWDDEAASICGLYSRLIARNEKNRRTLDERLKDLYEIIQFSPYAGALEPGFAPRPTGYVRDSFEAAIWAIAQAVREGHITFRECVLNAVNLGGDADTIGAITGGLAGSIFGFDGIPDEWIEGLEDKDTVEELTFFALEAARRNTLVEMTMTEG